MAMGHFCEVAETSHSIAVGPPLGTRVDKALTPLQNISKDAVLPASYTRRDPCHHGIGGAPASGN